MITSSIFASGSSHRRFHPMPSWVMVNSVLIRWDLMNARLRFSCWEALEMVLVRHLSDEREPRLRFRAILQYSHLVVSSMSDNQTSCVVSADRHISYRCGSDKLVDFTGKQILWRKWGFPVQMSVWPSSVILTKIPSVHAPQHDAHSCLNLSGWFPALRSTGNVWRTTYRRTYVFFLHL